MISAVALNLTLVVLGLAVSFRILTANLYLVRKLVGLAVSLLPRTRLRRRDKMVAKALCRKRFLFRQSLLMIPVIALNLIADLCLLGEQRLMAVAQLVIRAMRKVVSLRAPAGMMFYRRHRVPAGPHPRATFRSSRAKDGSIVFVSC